MAGTKTGYDAQKPEDKVRINAVIIDAFKDESFVAGFRKQIEAHKGMPRDKASQASLDELRNYLATDVSNLPKLTHRSAALSHDIGQQMQLLRDTLGMFDGEKPSFTRPNKEITDFVSKRLEQAYDTGTNKSYKLPKPDGEYKGKAEMLAKSAALAACSGMSGLSVAPEHGAACAHNAQTGAAKRR